MKKKTYQEPEMSVFKLSDKIDFNVLSKDDTQRYVDEIIDEETGHEAFSNRRGHGIFIWNDEPTDDEGLTYEKYELWSDDEYE